MVTPEAGQRRGNAAWQELQGRVSADLFGGTVPGAQTPQPPEDDPSVENVDTGATPDSTPGTEEEAQATSDDASADGEAGLEPEELPRDAQALLGMLEKERARRQKAESAIRNLKAERLAMTEEARQQRAMQALLDARPRDFAEWDADRQQAWFVTAATRQHDAEVREMMDAHRLSKELPGMSQTQYTAVREVMGELGLDPKDAHAIALARSPDLFRGRAGGRAPMPASHQVAEPGRSGKRRAPPDAKAPLVDAVRNATSQYDGLRALANLVKHGLENQKA